VIATRPTDGAPPFTTSEPPSAYNAANRARSWLLHAAAQRVAHLVTSASVIVPILVVQAVNSSSTPSTLPCRRRRCVNIGHAAFRVKLQAARLPESTHHRTSQQRSGGRCCAERIARLWSRAQHHQLTAPRGWEQTIRDNSVAVQ